MPTTELETFALNFFEKVDAQNAEKLRPFITEDVRLQMANLEPSNGADALIEAFKATEERFSSIRHDIQGIWTGTCDSGPVVSVEAIAHYALKNGSQVELPVTSTLRLTDDHRVADYRIFIDPNPAFS